MKLVVIESPYAGSVESNVLYARRAMADCLRRGEAPIASHLIYTQPGILDDTNPAERTQGIQAGLLWGAHAQAVVFYVDRGWSKGMRGALEHWKVLERPVVSRRILGVQEQTVLHEGPCLVVAHPKKPVQDYMKPPTELPLSLDAYHKECIRRALERAEGHPLDAAALLRVSKSSLYRWIEKYNFDVADFRSKS